MNAVYELLMISFKGNLVDISLRNTEGDVDTIPSISY